MDRSIDRRTYLATASAATTLAIAGCMGGGDPDEDEEDGDEETVDYPDAAGTYDDFEDLDQWDVREGSVSADSGNSAGGSQSALMSVAEAETQARMVRELDEPEDFTEVLPGVAMQGETDRKLVIQLIDGDGDRVEYEARSHAGSPFVRYNFGIGGVDGDPDLSAVEEIQLIMWLGDETAGELWVDDLHFVPRVDDGTVLIQLDGGYETQHPNALPVLEEHDVPATLFIPTGRIRESQAGEGTRLTMDQLAEFEEAGCTIASNGAHGLDLTTLEDRTPEDEVAEAADWLADEGFEPAYFSFPSGNCDEAALEAVESHHDLAFTGHAAAQGYASNPYLFQRVSNPDASQARDALDLTAEMGGITSIAFYALDDGGSQTAFQETVSYAAELASAGEVELVTPSDVTEYVYED